MLHSYSVSYCRPKLVSVVPSCFTISDVASLQNPPISTVPSSTVQDTWYSLSSCSRASNEGSQSLNLYNHREGSTNYFSWLRMAVTAFTFSQLEKLDNAKAA